MDALGVVVEVLDDGMRDARMANSSLNTERSVSACGDADEG